MESFQWLSDLFTTTDSVAHITLLYAIVIAIGVYLGKIKFFGVSLGVTFVLFAGILAGHIGFTAPTPILTFRTDTLCIHDRSAGRSWILRKLWYTGH